MKKRYALLLLLPLQVHAGWNLFDFKSEDAKPWVESDSALPAPPKPQNLIPFEVSPVTNNRHFIDAASVHVGSDDVVRYTVVIEAAGGATNVSHEGIRCDSGEQRVYAYGQADETWSASGNERWEAIKFDSARSYQRALSEDYFCAHGSQVKTGAEAVHNLRRTVQ